MYRGGLPLVGVASAALITGLQVQGPVRRLLEVRPLVGLGRISYGVYLYHWPIYVILDGARTNLSGLALLGLRLAATGLVAILSFVLIERPIRRADWRPRPTLVGSLVATAAVAVAAVAVPVTIADDYWRAAPDEIAALAATASTIPPVVADVVDHHCRDGRIGGRHAIGRDGRRGTGRVGGCGGFGARWGTRDDGHHDAGCHIQRAGDDRARARAHGRRLHSRGPRGWARRVGRRPPDTRRCTTGRVARLRIRAWRRDRDRRRRAVR